MSAPHPAKFTPAILEKLQELVDEWPRSPGMGNELPAVLDGFGGSGLIHTLERCTTHSIEIEPEWANDSMHLGYSMCADFFEYDPAEMIPFVRRRGGRWERRTPRRFHLGITSPTYGNRMAGNFVGDKAGKHRYIGYAPALGRPLTPGNTAETGWTDRYRRMHERAWAKYRELLIPGGWLVVNVKDHFRPGEDGQEKQPVVAWHRATMTRLGFELIYDIEVPVPSMKFGQNREARVDVEHILVGVRPCSPRAAARWAPGPSPSVGGEVSPGVAFSTPRGSSTVPRPLR